MNAAKVTQQYSELNAPERAALFINALGRGDEVEQCRLARTAPRVQYSATHSWRRTSGFVQLSQLVLLELLDYASQIWLGSFLVFRDGFMNNLPESITGPREPFTDAEVDTVFRASEAHRQRFLGTLDAWDAFCGELGIDSLALWQTWPGCWAVSMAERILRQSTSDPAPAELLNQAEMVKELHDALKTFDA